MKYFVAILCFALAGVRTLVPSITLDTNSLVLLLVGCLLLLIRNPEQMLSRVKKLKKGDFEVEFDTKLNQLNDATEKAERLVETLNEGAGLPLHIRKRLLDASQDPRATLLILAIEIEQAIQALAEERRIPKGKRYYAPTRMLEVLESDDVLDRKSVV